MSFQTSSSESRVRSMLSSYSRFKIALRSKEVETVEECIKELEADNAQGALGQCQSADDELDTLLGNSTG